jgi:prolyl-tRNA editing enzyme YbaK/EbsC (Cys-tRNA(Pro) deacylase)
MPVYAEITILNLPKFYINGGQRGFIIEMTPAELLRALKVTPIKVAR